MMFPISYLVYHVSYFVCLQITYLVYNENYLVHLLITTRTNQVGEHIMHVSLGFMVFVLRLQLGY